MIDYLFVGLIGGVVGTAELTSRYGNVGQIFRIAPSYYYILLNIGAACLVFALTGGAELPISNEYMNKEVARIMLAGTSAMFLLRSSFGSFKIGGNMVDIGPTAFLQVFLNEADRAYDRRRSVEDLSKVSEIMKNIDFEKAKTNLPTACLAMMKNVSLEEQKALGREVTDINKNNIAPSTKSLVLGLILADVTGSDLLQEAVTALGESIEEEPKTPAEENEEEDRSKKVNSLWGKYSKKV